MKVKIEIDEVNMPEFIIVGAGKSGTTSLHKYLEEHPDVFMPWLKETWFFHLIDNANRAILKRLPYLPTNLLSYLGLYEGAKPDQICGEATPSYLYYHDLTIANIKKYHPKWEELKIIIILREPIDKVISHYKFVHTHKLDPDNLNLLDALKQEHRRKEENVVLPDLFYVDNTLYYKQVKNYIDNFNNVKVFLYDDLKKDPQNLLKELYSFIGVDPNFKPKSLTKKFNQSKVRLVPKNILVDKVVKNLKGVRGLFPSKFQKRMQDFLFKEEDFDEETISFLKNAFRDDVRNLQGILKKDISHWLAKYD